MTEQLSLPITAPTIPASYWRLSLRALYRGASQETLDALLAECRAAERLAKTEAE